ncbi:hypothetical protein GQ457_07G037440 [Hibiscus cannabinus]
MTAINQTRIVLVPKVDDANSMEKFRPISLCNVLFKIISKCVVNRLQGFLSPCIDEAHSAFVPGRLISDNTLAAYEIIHHLRSQRSIAAHSIRFLSQGGKEVFIKSVLQAIPMYSMCCFLFPKSFCHELEQIIARFWWQHSRERRGIHYCTWSELCNLKDSGGLGFRDLAKFNVALLAKQGWRLLHNPSSLVARLLRAKYYSASTFLQARLGSNPSLTWRSIWSARGLLELGLRWQVGAGFSISIWNDFWLPAKVPKLISTAEVTGLHTVSDLIDQESREWKTTLVQEFFNPEDAEAILSIPLSSHEQMDRLVWCGEHSGIYSVRSGYKRLLSAPSLRDSDSVLFKKLWKSKCPSKINIQVWKFIRNFVPTKVNLCVKRVATNPLCARCNESSETTLHVIRDCHFARQVWEGLNYHFLQPIPAVLLYDLPLWLNSIVTHFGTGKLEEIFMIIWALWLYRNKFIFENENQRPEMVITFVKSYLMDLSIISNRWNLSNQVPTVQWSPPIPPFVKLNFDASFRQGERLASLGWVLRDDEGFILAAECALAHHISSSFAAEALAAKKGVKAAIDLGFRKVIVEGDSLTVITKLKSTDRDFSEIGAITEDTRCFLRNLECSRLSFIRRRGNRVAHELARERFSITADQSWIEEAPARIEAIAAEDRRCLDPP